MEIHEFRKVLRKNFPLPFAIMVLFIGLISCVLLAVGVRSAQPAIKQTLTGHINPEQVFSFVYVPFEVPPGTTSIYVLQNYTEKGAGNSLDLGIFDERGYQLADDTNGTIGSRGWSMPC